MRVRLLAFARLGELLGAQRDIEMADGSCVADAWRELAHAEPALVTLHESTRFARNGELCDAQVTLVDGDELALLPPVGGG